jgi:hypothetical protein
MPANPLSVGAPAPVGRLSRARRFGVGWTLSAAVNDRSTPGPALAGLQAAQVETAVAVDDRSG